MENPLSYIYGNDNNNIITNMVADANFSIKLPYNLTFKTQMGVILRSNRYSAFKDPTLVLPAKDVMGEVRYNTGESDRFIFDNTLSYDEIFKEAEALGYLEADPNLDVGGIDAGHKLALLASIGFGTKVNFEAVQLEGIGQISIDDINHAADMGFRIKLLGVAQLNGDGLEQRMSPCLVPAVSPLGQLEGGTNMVMLEGDHVGQIILSGPGAGEGPTASAVMADIIDIARGVRIPTFGQQANTLRNVQSVKSNTRAPYYLRLSLSDKPGALAKVASLLGDFGISIDRMRQYAHADENAPVLIVTHTTDPQSIEKALANVPKTGVVHDKPVALRIEPL